MKYTVIATLFAALFASGHAASVPEAGVPAVDPVPAATVPETGDNRELRGATIQDVPAATTTTGENKNNRKMKETSGQSCGMCCDDDFHC